MDHSGWRRMRGNAKRVIVVLFASKDSVSQWLDGWSRQWKWISKAVAEGRGRGSLARSLSSRVDTATARVCSPPCHVDA